MAEYSDAFVFFGATGDLAYKQIFPALQALTRLDPLTYGVDGVRGALIGVTHFGVAFDAAALAAVAVLLLAFGAWRFSKIEI